MYAHARSLFENRFQSNVQRLTKQIRVCGSFIRQELQQREGRVQPIWAQGQLGKRVWQHGIALEVKQEEGM
eukprot:7071033-Pyramimonas_sp.AAC.1